jgi:hypothetical protein
VELKNMQMGGWKFGRKCKKGYQAQKRDNTKGSRKTKSQTKIVTKPLIFTSHSKELIPEIIELIKMIYSYCKQQIKPRVLKDMPEKSSSVGFVNFEVLEVREIK